MIEGVGFEGTQVGAFLMDIMYVNKYKKMICESKNIAGKIKHIICTDIISVSG